MGRRKRKELCQNVPRLATGLRRLSWQPVQSNNTAHPMRPGRTSNGFFMSIRTTLGTDYILDALVAEGLRHLFLVPGGLVDPFLPALIRQPGLKPIIAAHEGGAVYMADGYARASGAFGAALGIGGPGACNMATAIAA